MSALDHKPAFSENELVSFWDRQPCNVRHSSLEEGTREYFEEVRYRRYLLEPHIPEFAEFGSWKDKRVLELGCGIGTDAVSFALAGAEVTAVDSSVHSLELAEQNARAFGVQIKFLHADLQDLYSVLSPCEYDLVYAFGVLHHLLYPERVLDLVRRHHMGEHSELRVMVYAYNSWKRVMIDAGLDQPEAQVGCPVARTYLSDELLTLLETWFQVVELQQRHLFRYDLSSYAADRSLKLAPWFEVMPQEMFSALEQALGWHLLVRARLRP
jgi:SAM-dependent methyltransferase